MQSYLCTIAVFPEDFQLYHTPSRLPSFRTEIVAYSRHCWTIKVLHQKIDSFKSDATVIELLLFYLLHRNEVCFSFSLGILFSLSPSTFFFIYCEKQSESF
ncbi:hypothetical protein ACH5RR_023777 [Cinchona calisaya]|uniref:Uncharacterized protein n=1 Tax=Cinchona calisaya TaxID=153742 RepID=A0ABD2ZBM8_9GENT